MKNYQKITIGLGIFTLAAVYAHSQPNTGTALRPQTEARATTTNVGSQGCYQEERVWVEGHWETGPGGRKTWRKGGWAVRQVPVPCAPPPPPSYPGFCPGPAPPAVFDGLMHTLRNVRFESDKVIVAKQMLAAHCVTSSQVETLLHAFDFESSRLEIAKFAYTRTCDPQNYFLVNNAFRFSSAIWELNRYIQGCM